MVVDWGGGCVKVVLVGRIPCPLTTRNTQMSHHAIETHVDYDMLATELMSGLSPLDEQVRGGNKLPSLIEKMIDEMIDEKIREKFAEEQASELEQMVIDHVNDELESKVGDVVDERMEEAVANIRCTLS